MFTAFLNSIYYGFCSTGKQILIASVFSHHSGHLLLFCKIRLCNSLQCKL